MTSSGGHLPRRILSTSCVMNERNSASSADSNFTEHTEVPIVNSGSRQRSYISKKKRKCRHWVSDSEKIDEFPSKKLPNVPPQDLSDFHSVRSELEVPLDYLYLFLNDELLNTIQLQSELYAAQHNETLYLEKMKYFKDFIAILLLSGYNHVPSRRMLWNEVADTRNETVCKAMRRDRFDQIMHFLHFSNNMEMNEDKYFKVRPLFQTLNAASKIPPLQKHLSIDEAIIPYYGRHGTKQFIRMKPIRFGFKLWCLCSNDGSLIHAEPYCGSSTVIEKTSLGQGGDVVLSLLEKSNVPEGHDRCIIVNSYLR